MYEFVDMIKPTYIFYLLSSGYRREIFHDSLHSPINWVPHRSTKHKERFGEDYSRLLVNEAFAEHQTYRGLMLIDAVASKHSTKIYVLPSFQEKFQAKIFYNFPNIVFKENLDNFRGENTTYFSKTILEKIKNSPYYGRDNYHLGAWWQYNVATEMWKLFVSDIGHQCF